MWDLGKPELLRVEPFCGALAGQLGNLNFKSGTLMRNLGEPEL